MLLAALTAICHAGDYTYVTNNESITITKYTGVGGNVTIPDEIDGLPVTEVGDASFYYKSSVTSVRIPDSVASIGDSAFALCLGLTNLTIGSAVTGIGNSAFYFCERLTSASIPNSVTNIGTFVFYGCAKLTNIAVEAENAFYSSVDGVLFNKNQSSLIRYPPSKVGSSYTVPDGVTVIQDGAMSRCSNLTEVPMPCSLTAIGNSAFEGCWGLTYLTIPDSVTSIGAAAFHGCSQLGKVAIPQNVVSIGEGPFRDCASLTAISVSPFNSCYSSVDGILFDKNQTALIQYPAGKAATAHTIPNNVTTIGHSAFFGCDSLASVTIPGSVTNIGTCAFQHCESLTNATIGSGVTSIGIQAFYACYSLASITIPSSVTSIGGDAFSWCQSLDAVCFQGDAPSFGHHVFLNAPNVTVYHLPGTAGWGATVGGQPTALWLLPFPVILTSRAGFGVQSHQFGFVISWATNADVVVEAATSLASPTWYPVATNTLTEGWSYFSDPDWANYPDRFYRVRKP